MNVSSALARAIVSSAIILLVSNGTALAEDSEESVTAAPTGSSLEQTEQGTPAPPVTQDRAGTVQAGVQDLANKLLVELDKAGTTGFRRLAVLPFDTLEPTAERKSLGRVSSELLSSRLAASPKILQVERARLDAVVGELKRSERGELSPDGAVSVGKLLGAQNVVLGSVASLGSDYNITARVVDSETGTVVASADTSVPQVGLLAISEDMVEVKSRFGAAMRSSVVPGWGQIYNGDLGRGLVYGATFFGLTAGAVASGFLGGQANDKYVENTPGTVQERANANRHYDRANYFLMGMGAIWAIAVSDAYFTGQDATTLNLEAAPTMGGAHLSLGGRF